MSSLSRRGMLIRDFPFHPGCARGELIRADMEWLNKSYSYVKNICLFAVIMFFVLRTFVVNTSG